MKIDTSSPTKSQSMNKKRPVSTVPKDEEEPIRLTRPPKEGNKPEKPPRKPPRNPSSGNHGTGTHGEGAEAKEYSK